MNGSFGISECVIRKTGALAIIATQKTVTQSIVALSI